MNLLKSQTLYLNPERVFFFLAIVFGLVFLIITPPFQTPDEINHFYRAYQISEGQFIAQKQDHRLGGEVPLSLIQISKPFKYICRNVNAKTNKDAIVNALDIPLNPGQKIFVDFPNTSMFSFVSYLPQSIGMAICRLINVHPLYMLYISRFISLLFWCISLFFVIRILPVGRWLMVLLALLPMSVFVSMSLSADVVTNVLSLFLIAYILNCAYAETYFGKKEFIIIVLISLLLASSKLIYAPLILLVLLIPEKKFSSHKMRYVQMGLLFLMVFVAMLIWSILLNHLYIPYTEYNEKFRNGIDLMPQANMYAQSQYILHHGTHIIHVFLNSWVNIGMYITGYIGTLGWLDTRLPLWLIAMAYLIIIVTALLDGNTNIKISVLHKVIFVLTVFVIDFLLIVSQYLTWDSVGDTMVGTIQGRYLIPVAPLIGLLLYNRRGNAIKVKIAIVILFTFSSLTYTSFILYDRYYVRPDFNYVSFSCDAEKITDTGYYITDTSAVFLAGAVTQSTEQARSGIYSCKVGRQHPSGMMYRLGNFSFGDSIIVDVWRYGNTGSIILSSESHGKYPAICEVIQKDTKGWEHLQLQYVMPHNKHKDDLLISVYNDSTDPVYFDDLRIIHGKKKP